MGLTCYLFLASERDSFKFEKRSQLFIRAHNAANNAERA